MSAMLTVIAVAVLCAALVVRRAYVAFIGRALAECRGFIAYLEHIRQRIGCYLERGDSLSDGFSSPALCRCGFLCDELRSDPRRAYAEAEGRLALGEEGRRILSDFFRSLGAGYLDGQMGAIALTLERLREVEKKESEELEKRTRVAGAVCICAALGLLLLLL